MYSTTIGVIPAFGKAAMNEGKLIQNLNNFKWVVY
jgi:hypothetical protein